MRWSIIRLIWLRELRDQLRDRRTVFMIAVLPILIYPLAGMGMMQLAMGFLNKEIVVGIEGREYLPPLSSRCTSLGPLPSLAWLTATPPGPGAPLGGVERVCAALALEQARRGDPGQSYPPLFLGEGEGLRFPTLYFAEPEQAGSLRVRTYDAVPVPAATDDADFLARVERAPLNNKQVDVLLVVPRDFRERLEAGARPELYLLTRENDDRSRLAATRVTAVLNRWQKQLKDVRLLRRGLPADYDEPFALRDTEKSKPAGKQAMAQFLTLMVRIFPFVLVMWSLAGALYPAVDLCAGEKERGTMETLLISPASREEIVWGKFLTIWVFSAATALLNLLSMGLTTWGFSMQLPGAAFWPLALLWGVVLLLPLSAFFSALCLAVGAYARSSKEGQYYLMPLFLLTMPLIFLTLAPGVELNAFYSMVPVTGVALLLQKLMAVGTPSHTLWLYFVPVLAPMVVYSWLALRWAIEQFQREEVLFREAERLDLGLWLRHLLRDKEPLPGAGAAVFCFGLILMLRWLFVTAAASVSILSQVAICQLAFVLTPPLFMALLLTTRPRDGLGLRRPLPWAWFAAGLLAVLLLPPLAELGRLSVLLLEPDRAILDQLRTLIASEAFGPSRLRAFLVFVLVPALCEELAFRGFILNGLSRRFRPWKAVLLSSFLFAVYQMNVFQLLPYFVLGVALATLSLRSGSILPAVFFRLVYNAALIAPLLFATHVPEMGPVSVGGSLSFVYLVVVLGCSLLAAGLLVIIWLLGRRAEVPAGTSGWTAKPHSTLAKVELADSAHPTS